MQLIVSQGDGEGLRNGAAVPDSVAHRFTVHVHNDSGGLVPLRSRFSADLRVE